MRTRNVLLSVLVGLGVASCGENSPPSTTDKPAPLTNPKPYGEAPQAAPVPQVASVMQTAPPAPISIAKAQWTISCDTIDGPAHVTEANIRKQQLIAASHMPDWYAIHTETKSEIYYGHYGNSKDEPAEKRRQEADRARILALLDRLGNPMVRGAVLTPVSMPDPTTPNDWNLLNTPREAYWTIEFATFSADNSDHLDRKQAAVEMVRYYREQEHRTDIYYFHGPTVSSVCVGAWKREAMAEQGTRTDNKGQLRDDANTQSADMSLLVIAGLAPANTPSRSVDPSTGKPMMIQGLKRDVVDPDMKKAMVEFHDIVVNGRKQYQDSAGQSGQTEAVASSIVQIPHDQAPTPVTDENWRLGVGQPAAPQQRQQGAGDNILRSIGSH